MAAKRLRNRSLLQKHSRITRFAGRPRSWPPSRLSGHPFRRKPPDSGAAIAGGKIALYSVSQLDLVERHEDASK